MLIDIQNDRSERVKYDYCDFPVYVRRAPLSVFPDFSADSHWHDDIELIMVMSGQMLYKINGEITVLNEGEGLIVNSKQLHYGFSKTKKECDFICILFHPVLVCSSKTFEENYVKPFLESSVSFVHLSPDILWQKDALSYIESIWNCNSEKNAPLHIHGMIYLLWEAIVNNLSCANSNFKTDSNLTTLKTMMTFTREHANEKITLCDIALSGHISKRTCGYLFLKYLNQTPIEFLNDYRLRKSIELLKSTDMTILEISLAVGFSGASYYAEAFKKRFGKSPSEQRKLFKNL